MRMTETNTKTPWRQPSEEHERASVFSTSLEPGVGNRTARVSTCIARQILYLIVVIECLRLTKALVKTGETLQSVADLYDDHARRTQLHTHDMLKTVAHPAPIYAVREHQVTSFPVLTCLSAFYSPSLTPTRTHFGATRSHLALPTLSTSRLLRAAKQC